jgi:hypothetical protein
MDTCSRPTDCGDGNCYTYAQTHVVNGNVTMSYDQVCFTPAVGFVNNFPCAADAQCFSGMCDRDVSICAQPCCAIADCGPTETCSAYGIDPYTSIKVCTPRGPGGGTLGTACTQGPDCQSGLCMREKCSTTCCTDRDCQAMPGTNVCRPESGPIANTLLGVCVPK